MFIKNRRFGWALAAWIVALPSALCAGPFFGDVCPPRDCPPGDYCPLHYWLPGYYRLRSCAHPSNLDQYPQGPAVAIGGSLVGQPCRTVPPGPTSPYANPEGYYGRSMTPYVGFGER